MLVKDEMLHGQCCVQAAHWWPCLTPKDQGPILGWEGAIMSVYSREAADWGGSGYGPLLATPSVSIVFDIRCTHLGSPSKIISLLLGLQHSALQTPFLLHLILPVSVLFNKAPTLVPAGASWLDSSFISLAVGGRVSIENPGVPLHGRSSGVCEGSGLRPRVFGGRWAAQDFILAQRP